MDNNLEILKRVTLFETIEEKDLGHLVHCLNTHTKVYEEGEIIFSLGEVVNFIGIVLEGQVEVVKESVSGNRHIVALLGVSHMFAEGIVCTKNRMSPVTVRSRQQTKILFIPYEKIVRSCTNGCSFHVQLIKNMLRVLGEKNYALNNKIDYLVLKGMRQKLATYLLNEAQKKESSSFNIHLNRNELAEYLGVCRSAMSRELSRMKAEGLIDYYKNGFKILDRGALSKCIEDK